MGELCESQQAASEITPNTPPNHPGLTSKATTSPIFEWPKLGTRGQYRGTQWVGWLSLVHTLTSDAGPQSHFERMLEWALW